MEKQNETDKVTPDKRTDDLIARLLGLIRSSAAPSDLLYYQLGNAYRKRGNFSEALNCYLEAMALNPDSPAAEAHRMLTDIIDEWMYNNTQEHRYNLSDATENRMVLEQVRIPLYRANGMPMDTRAFANNLRRFLRAEPYKVTCKLLTKGLGKAILVIGEK